jgi:hypothetical protein
LGAHVVVVVTRPEEIDVTGDRVEVVDGEVVDGIVVADCHFILRKASPLFS